MLYWVLFSLCFRHKTKSQFSCSYTRQNIQIPFRLTSASNYNKYSSRSLYRWIKSQSADWKATCERLLMIQGSKNSCWDVICPLYRERKHVGEILKIRARWRNIHVSVLLLTIKISQWARENFDSYCKMVFSKAVAKMECFGSTLWKLTGPLGNWTSNDFSCPDRQGHIS